MNVTSSLLASPGAALDRYFGEHVASGRTMRCASAAACQTDAARRGCTLRRAQLSYVGSHYGVRQGPHDLRVLVVGKDTGQATEFVTMVERAAEVRPRIGGPRNNHMKGVVLALRAAFGLPVSGTNRATVEYIATDEGRVHVLDAYAMANTLLCSAKTPTGHNRSTAPSSAMRRSCAAHLRRTLEILAPTLVICQGAAARDSVHALARPDARAQHWGVGTIAGRPLAVAWFGHPSVRGAGRWQEVHNTYYRDVVVPAIRAAREVALELAA